MIEKSSQQPREPERGEEPGRGDYPDDYGPETEEGDCVCPICGKRFPRRKGIPCYSETCPECGQKMTRA